MYCDLSLKPRLKVLVEDIKIVLRIMLEVHYDTSNQLIDLFHYFSPSFKIFQTISV